LIRTKKSFVKIGLMLIHYRRNIYI